MDARTKSVQLGAVCGSRSLILKSEGDGGTSAAFLRLRCHSWLCPHCRPRKARRFSRAVESFFSGRRVRLLTITVDRSASLWESWKSISGRWNHLRTIMTREFGKFSFVRVVEPQPKSGYPHFHILVDCFVPAVSFSALLRQSGFGKIWDVRLIHSREAFFYVRKYLSKPWPFGEALDASVEFRSRRISGSRGFSLANSSGVRWSVVGLVESQRGFVAFSIWWAKNFQNSLWELSGVFSWDDWTCLVSSSVIPSLGGLVSKFDLEPLEFAWPF